MRTLRRLVRQGLQLVVTKYGWDLGRKPDYYANPNETSKCRHKLTPFCPGYGIYIGPLVATPSRQPPYVF